MITLRKRTGRPKKPDTFVGPQDGRAIWVRYTFPAVDMNTGGWGEHWFAARYSLKRPFTWTPIKPFWFGGKEFKGGHPCAAWAGKDFGFIVQKGPEGLTFGKE